MTDTTNPADIASEVVELVDFATQFSRLLGDTIGNCNSNSKRVDELTRELSDLRDVLHDLYVRVTEPALDFSALKIPLFNCGQICKNFAELILKSTPDSNTGLKKKSLIHLKYKGKDFRAFSIVITAYKSTIKIALEDANICENDMTEDSLEELRDLIEDTTFDLQEILKSNNEDDGDASTNSQSAGRSGLNDTSYTENQRLSITQCLKICSETSKHIEETQRELSERQENGNKSASPGTILITSSRAQRITNQELDNRHDKISAGPFELQARLRDLKRYVNELQQGLPDTASSFENQDFISSVKAGVASVQNRISDCEEAAERESRKGVNIMEDVKASENSSQTGVSTTSDRVSAKRMSAGPQANQNFGQMSNKSLQKLSDNHRANIAHLNDVVRQNGGSDSVGAPATVADGVSDLMFVRQGTGWRLREGTISNAEQFPEKLFLKMFRVQNFDKLKPDHYTVIKFDTQI